MKKQLKDSDLREKLLSGAIRIAESVGATLGPRGQCVILKDKKGKPVITKDGVTVAKFLEFEDPFENLAAEVIKQSSESTNTVAGDGTTTSTILAAAILKECIECIESNSVSPLNLKRGIDMAVDEIVNKISKSSTPIRNKEDIAHVASVSANGDTSIGNLIATAVDAVGKDGSITIEDARSHNTSLELLEGFNFDSGLVSPRFITNKRKGTLRYENPLIFITDHNISSIDDILPSLQIAARSGKPFIIVAEEVEGQALAALILNAMKDQMKVAAIKAPRYGEERRNILNDLCISTGATFISRESGIPLQAVRLEHFGQAQVIESSKNYTTIVGGNQSQQEVSDTIESLKNLIQETDDLNLCEKIQERITRLVSGAAKIKVGGNTEVEVVEKKHRIEDALEAVKSALVDGIVPGGGVTLMRAANNLDIEMDNEQVQFGVDIIKKVSTAGFRKMMSNAFMEERAEEIIEKILSHENLESGFDISSEEFVNLLNLGIIDPTKVVCCSLQNAASAATTLMMSSVAVIDM